MRKRKKPETQAKPIPDKDLEQAPGAGGDRVKPMQVF